MVGSDSVQSADSMANPARLCFWNVHGCDRAYPSLSHPAGFLFLPVTWLQVLCKRKFKVHLLVRMDDPWNDQDRRLKL